MSVLEVENTQLEAAKVEVLEAAKRSNLSKWDIGDALVHLVNASSEQEMKKFIREEKLEEKFGLSEITLRGYKLVAEKWPPERRVDASFAVHKELVDPANRHLIRPGMTIAEAHRARLAWATERRKVTETVPVDTHEEGPPPEETFDTNKDPKDYPLAARDEKYEQVRLTNMLLDAAMDLRDVAERLEELTTEAWPDRDEWQTTILDIQGSVKIIDNFL